MIANTHVTLYNFAPFAVLLCSDSRGYRLFIRISTVLNGFMLTKRANC